MYIFIGLLSLLVAFVFLILIVVSLFTKNKMKRNLIGFFSCFAVFFICFTIMPSPSEEASPEEESEEQGSSALQLEEEEKPVENDFDMLPNAQQSTEEQESPPEVILLTEAQREAVLNTDSAIWSRILSAETNYNKLLAAMETTDSLYTLYRFCEELEDLMGTYSSDIGKISDKNAEEYIECAGRYIYQIQNIASHVKKYANKGDMKELSKAQDGMQNLSSFTQAVAIARFSYLSACGFSDDEIIEIGDNSIE